jgi:anti-anti-sigma factor
MSTHEFQLEVTREPDRTRVRPIGELDPGTVDRVEGALRDLLAEGARDVVLDLSALTFMDSSGLSLTLRWSLAAAQDGFAFSLVPGRPPVQRVFDLAGIAGQLRFRAGQD